MKTMGSLSLFLLARSHPPRSSSKTEFTFAFLLTIDKLNKIKYVSYLPEDIFKKVLFNIHSLEHI